MRILQVVPRFSPEHGGGGVVIAQSLARELAKRGHKVGIFTSDYELSEDDICKFQNETPNHIWLFPFKVKFNLATMHITRVPIDLGQAIFAEGVDSGVDVIHMQGCRTFQNIIVHHYAKKYGIPYIVDAHGFPIEGTWLRRLFIRLFDTLFANRIVRGADFCIAETQIGVEEYKRAGVDESKIVVIPCPYDLSTFDSLPKRGNFKKGYGLQRQHIILYLGGLDYIKGLDFLVKAFAKAKKRLKAQLVIVGSDWGYEKTLRGIVKELGIEKWVTFIGYLGGKDKLEALVDADVAVFPSRAEQGLPFAALEAIMCDTPVIVSGITGASEDIFKMNGGYIVQKDNVDSLAHMIKFVFSDPEGITLSRELVNNAQAYIKKNLSMAERVKDYEALYRRCVE